MAIPRFLTPDTPPTPLTVCRAFRLPNDTSVLGLITGALIELTKEYNWETFGDMSPADTAAYFSERLDEFLESSVCMIGSIHAFAVSGTPAGFLPCDGTVYQRENYPELYAVLDPVLIIDADTFQTPDLRDKTIRAAGTTHTPLQTAGSDIVNLTAAQNGPHTHTTIDHSHSVLPHTHAEGIAVPSPTLFGEIPSPLGGVTPTPSVTGPGSDTVLSSGVTVNQSGNGSDIDVRGSLIALSHYIMAGR